MFKELAPLLEKRSIVLILTGLDNGNIRVNVIPKATDKDTDAALLTPLNITAQPNELDAGLSVALTGYTNKYLTINESLDKTKAEMEAAETEAKDALKAKEAAAKAKTKAAVKATPTKAEPAAPSLFDAANPAVSTPTTIAETSPVDDEDDSNDEEEEG